MNIILKPLIVLALIFLPSICNADNFELILDKELSYQKTRISNSKSTQKWYKKGDIYDGYTKKIEDAQTKLDNLNNIDAKDKAKIMTQVANNIDERIKAQELKIKTTIKKNENYLKAVKVFYPDTKLSKLRLAQVKQAKKHLNSLKEYKNNALNEKKFLKTGEKYVLKGVFIRSQLRLKATSTRSNLENFTTKFKTWKTTDGKAKIVKIIVPNSDKYSQRFKSLKSSTDKKPKVAIETPRKKKKWVSVQAIAAPPPPKERTVALNPPPQITTPKKPKTKIAKSSNEKTILKNVNILTTAKTGNINTKGKLSIANVKVAKGTTLKDTNINANVDIKNISVAKGSSADIGSVNIKD